MRKRSLCLVLAVLLLFAACQSQTAKTQNGEFLFYYPSQNPSYQDDSAFCSAVANIHADELSLEELMREYLRSTPPVGGQSPIPEEWRLCSAELQDSAAVLVFEGTSTQPLARSLSVTGIAMTLLQLPGVQRINITTPESTDALSLSADDFALKDTGMLPQKETLVLYHPDAERRFLIREILTVEAMDAKEKPAYLMRQLLTASQRGYTSTCIPDGTELLDIRVENGICTVDLSSEFQSGFEQSFAAERMAIYSIVNSLTELPQINTVDLWVAGAPLERLYHMELSSGVIRDERLFAVPESKDTTEAVIYPACVADGLLVPISLALQQDPEKQLAVQVVEALIGYEGRNGLSSCIPEGTKILSLRMEGTACIIDLTGEFIDGCKNSQQELLAVRATVATLCALPSITSVEILVEGITPNYINDSLNGVQHYNYAWISE